MESLEAIPANEKPEIEWKATCTLGHQGVDITITNNKNLFLEAFELTISEAEKLYNDLSEAIKQAKELDTIYDKDYSK